ncbi:hypothetical protein ACFVIM_10595 [Streptomyces sp. NPDC057638]|uniref:hypothetical protein n=1 Tax=Streptomyces sp. NPDC057638 TaxID=3346190 RepID=UPI0036C88A18
MSSDQQYPHGYDPHQGAQQGPHHGPHQGAYPPPEAGWPPPPQGPGYPDPSAAPYQDAAYHPYADPAGSYPAPPNPYQENAVHQGSAAQTWEGETWDTHYQPVVGTQGPSASAPSASPAGGGAYPPPPVAGEAPTAYIPPVRDEAPTAYIPPVRDDAPTAYMPPVPDEAAAPPARRHGRRGQQGRHAGTAGQPGAGPLPGYAPGPHPVGAAGPLPPEHPAGHGPYGPPAHRAPAPTPAPVPPAVRTPAPVPPAQSAPAATGATAADGYGTPTLAGNARVTDAQRARAEGRSPIIAPGIQPAALTAVLGLLLAGGAALGSYGLLVPLVLLQAVTAAGWFRLNGMWPARQGIALAFAGGLTADAVLLAVGREHGPTAILGTLGAWVLITVVLQLRSHAGADERMYGLMASVASAALTILAAGHLAAATDAVVVGGVAVAVATLVRALPLPALPGAVSVVGALAAAAGAGVIVGGMTGLGSGAALLGAAAGALALVGLRVASYDYPSRFVHFTAGVALPLTMAAPAVYLLGRALA